MISNNLINYNFCKFYCNNCTFYRLVIDNFSQFIKSNKDESIVIIHFIS